MKKSSFYKFLCVLVLLTIFSEYAHAQKRNQRRENKRFTLGLGILLPYTKMNSPENKELSKSAIGIGGSLFCQYELSQKFSLQSDFSWLQEQATDVHYIVTDDRSTGTYYRQNLRFALGANYYPLEKQREGFSPYITALVAGDYSPQTLFSFDEVIVPKKTIDASDEFKPFDVGAHIGVGGEYVISPTGLGIRLQASKRFGFMDISNYAPDMNRSLSHASVKMSGWYLSIAVTYKL